MKLCHFTQKTNVIFIKFIIKNFDIEIRSVMRPLD